MILRRITEHVKSQNWFAVGIDFVIVVVGVVIGIQVANWNETLVEQRRIAEQLASFRDELILSRVDLANRQAYYEDRVASVAELRERLESGGDLSADDFNRLVVSATRGRGLDMTFRGYEEITTTGTISKVADDQLRDLLYRWNMNLTGIKNLDKAIETTRNRTIIPIVLESTALGNALQSDDRYEDMTVTERFEFDIENLRRNRTFDGALAVRHVQARQQLNSLLDFIATTEDVIAALDN